MEEIKLLLSQYPFLTYLVYGGNEYIGIIQNSDEQITTMYDFGSLRDSDQKRKFLDFGEQWWWESNRMIPINIFLKQPWAKFSYTLVTLSTKDVREIQGHVVSLSNLASKRTKRRVVQLVRRLT